MKIAVLLTYANPHVLGWVKKLNKDQNEIRIGCINSVKSFRKGYFEEVDNYSDILYFFKSVSAKKQFRDFLREADVLITLGIFEKELLKSLLVIDSKVPVYVLSEPFEGIENAKKNIYRKYYSKLVRLLHPNINFLAIGGKTVKEHYLKFGFRNSNFFNFGHFPDFIETNIDHIKENEDLNFLFVGQLVERKGIQKVIFLLNYLMEEYKHEKWTFKIVGDGIKRTELEAYVKQVADKRIQLLGLINDPNKLDGIYEESNVLFIPSVFDGWGAVINEAISKKMIILSSKTAFASTFLVENGKNGYKFHYNSNQEIKNSLDYLFKNSTGVMDMRKYSDKIYLEWNPLNAANSLELFLKNNFNSNYSLLKEI